MLCVTQVFAQNRTLQVRLLLRMTDCLFPGFRKVKGTSTGVQTNTAGKFTLSAPSNATLVFSFIGYNTLELPARNGR